MKQPRPSSDTESLFKLVHDDVLNLIVTRQVFDRLYKETADVQLLNRIASQTFSFIQRLFYDSLLMGTARLFDVHKDTASLPILISAVRRDGLNDLAKSMNAAMPSGHLRDRVKAHRDKRAAHTERLTRAGVKKLPTLVLGDISTCTDAAHAVINTYSIAVHRATLSRAVLLQTKGGPHVLLDRLREAEEYREAHPDYWLPNAFRRSQGAAP